MQKVGCSTKEHFYLKKMIERAPGVFLHQLSWKDAI
jgi:hypothetical protein